MCLQVPLNEYDFPQSKLASVQAQLERLVEKNYYLHQSARDAYRCGLPGSVGCVLWYHHIRLTRHMCTTPTSGYPTFWVGH
jgi:hypothetical protein